jgi:large subunit ribosomal protein L15
MLSIQRVAMSQLHPLLQQEQLRDSLPVKVLGNGEISVKVTVTAHAFSSSAIDKITAAGGSTATL